MLARYICFSDNTPRDNFTLPDGTKYAVIKGTEYVVINGTLENGTTAPEDATSAGFKLGLYLTPSGTWAFALLLFA